jgi:ABC-type thiamin/hydroxymethylpyrimidine transport system permease subunit
MLEGTVFGLAAAGSGFTAAIWGVENPWFILGLSMAVLSIACGVQFLRHRRWALWGGLVIEFIVTLELLAAFVYRVWQINQETAQVRRFPPMQEFVDGQVRGLWFIGLMVAATLVGPAILWRSRVSHSSAHPGPA